MHKKLKISSNHEIFSVFDKKMSFYENLRETGHEKCYLENLHILSASVAYFSVLVDFLISTSPK